MPLGGLYSTHTSVPWYFPRVLAVDQHFVANLKNPFFAKFCSKFVTFFCIFSAFLHKKCWKWLFPPLVEIHHKCFVKSLKISQWPGWAKTGIILASHSLDKIPIYVHFCYTLNFTNTSFPLTEISRTCPLYLVRYLAPESEFTSNGKTSQPEEGKACRKLFFHASFLFSSPQ